MSRLALAVAVGRSRRLDPDQAHALAGVEDQRIPVQHTNDPSTLTGGQRLQRVVRAISGRRQRQKS